MCVLWLHEGILILFPISNIRQEYNSCFILYSVHVNRYCQHTRNSWLLPSKSLSDRVGSGPSSGRPYGPASVDYEPSEGLSLTSLHCVRLCFSEEVIPGLADKAVGSHWKLPYPGISHTRSDDLWSRKPIHDWRRSSLTAAAAAHQWGSPAYLTNTCFSQLRHHLKRKSLVSCKIYCQRALL